MYVYQRYVPVCYRLGCYGHVCCGVAEACLRRLLQAPMTCLPLDLLECAKHVCSRLVVTYLHVRLRNAGACVLQASMLCLVLQALDACVGVMQASAAGGVRIILTSEEPLSQIEKLITTTVKVRGTTANHITPCA